MGTPAFFNLNPVNFLILSGIIQNFILVGILFFRRGDQALASKLLSTTIFIVNLHLTYLMVLDTNVDNLYPQSTNIPYSFLTALGPIIFFYTRSLTNSDFSISGKDLRHFFPVIVEVVIQVAMILYGRSHNQIFYNTPFYFYVVPLLYLWAAGSIVYYLRLSISVIKEHEALALRNFSNLKEITLRWLQKLIVYYRLLWIVWVPFVTTFLLFFRFQLLYITVVLLLYFLMLILTYLTFWIGMEGLGRTNIVILKDREDKPENKNFVRLTADEIQSYTERMLQLMTAEKLYLNENLSLKDFSAHLKSDPNLISHILNKFLRQTFYDFVNHYRIEEAKNRLKDPRYAHINVLGIGLESGFNSKTTFNRVFKQVTGMTPSEFQKK